MSVVKSIITYDLLILAEDVCDVRSLGHKEHHAPPRLVIVGPLRIALDSRCHAAPMTHDDEHLVLMLLVSDLDPVTKVDQTPFTNPPMLDTFLNGVRLGHLMLSIGVHVIMRRLPEHR